MKYGYLHITVFWTTIYIVWILPHNLLAQNSSVQLHNIPENAVKINDRGSYYQVTMDYTSGISNYDLGVELGQKILQVKPDYEQLMDSYIAEVAAGQYLYNAYICRVNDIKPRMHKEYQDEIDGMASQFSGGNVNSMGDNKLSKDEFYMFQLLADVDRSTQCSGISIYGEFSETGRPMTARILDWFAGTKHQLAQIQAVTTIRYNSQSICLIGYLGHLTMITGFNNKGVFAGILESGTDVVYCSTGKYSFTSDLRYALETSATLSDVAGFVINPSRNYTSNHNVLLSDNQTSRVLENNFSGTGTNMQRALRSDTSALNPGITWEYTNAVAVVNSFLLKGNHDNHTISNWNRCRWNTFKEQLYKFGKTITFDELKLIASYDYDNGPSTFSYYDIYNSNTQQIVLFQPDNFYLEVAFRPKSGILTDDPVFETIQGVFNTNQVCVLYLNINKKAPAAVNDTITINTIIENPNVHELSVKLILESMDGVIADSVEMFPVDLASNNSRQCKLISENYTEDVFILSLKVTDNTDGTYYTNKHFTRIINVPIELSKITFTQISANIYKIQPNLKNAGKSKVLTNPKIDITSNDPWIKSICPNSTTLSYLKPGKPRNTENFKILSDAATFPGYFNLKFNISIDDWTYWTIDTTIAVIPTGIEEVESLPLVFGLEQNYPNPFSSVTTIPWQLAENGKVTLKVLDILGRTLATLIDEQRPSGNYETQFNAAILPKGIYFYQLKAGEKMQTRKMILLE